MTYACPAWELVADTYLLKLQHLQKKVLHTTLDIFQGVVWFKICTRLSTFCMHMIIKQNYAGNKQKSYKIMRMNMFALKGNAKPDTENIRGLILVVIMLMTVQVTKLLL
jgi:hypothetical protein